MTLEGLAAVLGVDCSCKRHAKGQHFKRLNNEERTCEPLITATVIVWRCGAMQQSSSGGASAVIKCKDWSNLDPIALAELWPILCSAGSFILFYFISFIYFLLLETMTISSSYGFLELNDVREREIIYLLFFWKLWKDVGSSSMPIYKEVSFLSPFFFLKFQFCWHSLETCTNSVYVLTNIWTKPFINHCFIFPHLFSFFFKKLKSNCLCTVGCKLQFSIIICLHSIITAIKSSLSRDI